MKNFAEFKCLADLLKRFPDEQSCRDYIADLRWNGSVRCAHCDHSKVYTYKDGKLFKCAKCKKQFTVKVGTIFEDSTLPLQKWFMALYFATAHKKGISSLQLSRDLGITQKSAWFMMHRIREIFKADRTQMLSGVVEVDETYIGGADKNKHYDKKSKVKGVSPGKSSKSTVIGLVERKGNVVSMPIYNATKDVLTTVINTEVKHKSTLYTDDYNVYAELKRDYNHSSINHSAKVYVMGNVHTNTIEGFWSLLKRGIIGIYHSVSPKHLHRYCNEFNYRYNTKNSSDVNRFALTISKLKGRLMYKDLIAK